MLHRLPEQWIDKLRLAPDVAGDDDIWPLVRLLEDAHHEGQPFDIGGIYVDASRYAAAYQVTTSGRYPSCSGVRVATCQRDEQHVALATGRSSRWSGVRVCSQGWYRRRPSPFTRWTSQDRVPAPLWACQGCPTTVYTMATTRAHGSSGGAAWAALLQSAVLRLSPLCPARRAGVRRYSGRGTAS